MELIKVLIVDDEADAGEILSLRLARRSIANHYVTSGQAAFDYLATQTVDLVLLDIKMPDMDGLEVLSRIKELYPNIIVIIISGHADMDVAAQGLEMGAFFYLLKPIEIEALCHKIEDAIEQRNLCQPDG